MKVSNAETLIIAMLAEIYEKLGIAGPQNLDPAFIKSALADDAMWSLSWKYSGLFPQPEAAPAHVGEAAGFLEMWETIERQLDQLDATKKAELHEKARAAGSTTTFRGFDGNGEVEHLSAVRFMIDELSKFDHFKGRELNSHIPLLPRYRAMFKEYRARLSTVVQGHPSPDDLLAILLAQRN